MNAHGQLQLLGPQTSADANAEPRPTPVRASDYPLDARSPTAARGQTSLLHTIIPNMDLERQRTQRQIIKHHWECTVVRIHAATFLATLRSLRDENDSEKEAEIPLEEVSPDDLELLQPGAVFYWTIGYDISPSGTRRRASEIKFRRLPSWTKGDIARVRDQANELFDLFGTSNDASRQASA
jgi:hypothetical protein